MPLPGADFSENAKPLAQAYAVAESGRLAILGRLREVRSKLNGSDTVSYSEREIWDMLDYIAEEVTIHDSSHD